MASALKPIRGETLLLPASDPAEYKGLRTAYSQQYPQTAWVLAKGEGVQEVEVGDLVVLEVESTDVARIYSRVLEVHFKDGQYALFDPDMEPLIKELFEEYCRNPSSADKRIRCLAVDQEGFQFLTSDILTLGWRETSTKEFSLLYPINLKMFWLWIGANMQLFYIAREENILGCIAD